MCNNVGVCPKQTSDWNVLSIYIVKPPVTDDSEHCCQLNCDLQYTIKSILRH